MNDGQVSKALLEVGGTEIQQELKNSYPDGINIGDIAISGGGKLMCGKLLHCCLPEEKDEENIQAVRLVKLLLMLPLLLLILLSLRSS